jgi:hypothetical protein
MRTQEQVDEAIRLLTKGQTPTEVANVLRIPRSTVRDWSCGRSLRIPRDGVCENHLSNLDPPAYAYLLGMYLGDGCISQHDRGVLRLRITLDAQYPCIIGECAAAVADVAPGKSAAIYRRRDGRCVEVYSYWKHWSCLFPQHGSGRKHERPIELVDWQQAIVDSHPELLVRGLIHSDGCRIVATERKGDYVRRAPRYGFSNRSEDILELFGAACTSLGIHFTRASVKQIAVYSKDAVARLDEFVGPKR